MIAREEKVCVAELTEALNESQPKISRHLALLRASGVVVDIRQGQWVFYRISDQLPGWMRKQIQGWWSPTALNKNTSKIFSA